MFVEGISGNPAGRRKGSTPPTLRKLAMPHRKLAIDTLVELAKGAEDERVRLAAALALADRSDGKPRNEAPAENDGWEPSDGPRKMREEIAAEDEAEGNGGCPDGSSSDGDA